MPSKAKSPDSALPPPVIPPPAPRLDPSEITQNAPEGNHYPTLRDINTLEFDNKMWDVFDATRGNPKAQKKKIHDLFEQRFFGNSESKSSENQNGNSDE
ncbi:MAG TPA: hypothetical protein VKK79_26355 [Candidatus Lokiarchaeia archaeon]|nr:hypothetical protein [Candidatus Lokiarchaeia archaeon]